MTNARRLVALVVAIIAVLASAVLSPVTLLTSANARGQATSISVTVLSVNPSTPAITTTARPLTITVSLVNNTSNSLPAVTLTAQRGSPITTQAALTASLSSSAARSGGIAIAPVKAVTVTLPPGVAVTTTFSTTTSLQDNTGRICLCHNAVYPIDLTAQSTSDGVTQALGGARTYLSSFDTQPAHKLGVTWVWPLIDRPHRNADRLVFTDDELAASVSGGRLDRALTVLEGVAGSVPVTLVVDPDLIDELQVMATVRYTVRASDGTVTVGTGQQAAAAWLNRLRAVLATQPEVDLELTALADPDVTGLTQHHIAWSASLSSTIAASVTAALGGRPSHAVAWPPSNSATVGTLDTLVSDGADTVLLDGSQVKPSTNAGGIPASAARVRTTSGTVKALLTSPALQTYSQSALAGSTAALPQLTSELSVRVYQRPNTSQTAVLAAPRYVDPKIPSVAIDTILATSSSVFSQPVTASAVTGQVSGSTSRSSVRVPAANSNGLSTGQLDATESMTDYVPAVRSLIGGSGGSAAGRSVVATLPDDVQRSESASWSQAGQSSGIGGGPSAGRARTTALSSQLTGYLGQVSILPPKSGNYTLASSNSPLPISVRNDSALSMRIRVTVSTVGGLPGFSARAQTVQIPGRSKTTIKIPTDVQRSGRIPVTAQLHTTNNYLLGSAVTLSVHSTVLGTIGVVITVAAGVILVLALLVRYVRRVLRLRSRGRSPLSTQQTTQQSEPAP